MKVKDIVKIPKFWGKNKNIDFKKLNKKVVAAIIAAVVVVSAIAGVSGYKYVNAKSANEETETTIQVDNQSIEKTLAATGTIISAQESGQFATTTNSYPVEEVYVKVGDVVKAGDPLYKLDMSTMEEQLSYQQQALNIQNQQNAISESNATKALQDAKDTGAAQINEANRNLDQAKQDQNTANRNKSASNNALDAAKNTENDAKTALDNATAALSNAQAKVSSLNTTISNLQNQINSANASASTESTDGTEESTTDSATVDTTDLQNQLDQAKKDLASAQEAVTTAQADVNAKREAYKSATAAREEAEKGVQSANDSVANANRSVDTAQANTNTTSNSANSNIVSQSQSLKSAQLSSQSSTLSAKEEISKSQDELSKATVYASMDGTVTNVNIVAGQTYSGTDAVVIDDVSSMKATADIDEAQIPNIAVGQKVQIKTDATGDTVLDGTVVFVSPTATKNSTKSTDGSSTTASVSKTRATYRVDVQIDSPNDALRLGMTAKMTFVIANKDNALAVPTADIQTDVDGSKYVVVQNKDKSTKNVKIETGISDEFYTEVTGGDLKSGDTIVENTSDGSADAVLDSMGADGGIYFE